MRSLVLLVAALLAIGCGSTGSGPATQNPNPPTPIPAITISNIAAGSVTNSGAQISWSTNVSATSQVEYGATSSYGSSTALISALSMTHSVTLSGLASSSHYSFRVRSKDSNGVEAISGNFTFDTSSSSVADTNPPTISISSPVGGAAVGGTVNLSATASDNVGVVGVQFLVDGSTVGTEQTSSPYNISWNSASVANGSHAISARARDAAGNAATSAVVTVSVSNLSTSGGNNFQARCQAPGVFRCWDFEDATTTAAHLMPPFGSTTLQGQVVNDVVADGNGALRFTVPSPSGADGAGSFFLNFADDLSKQFGEGQEFFLQYRVRYNDVMVNTHFNNSNGFKMHITGEGDRPGFTAFSCTTLELPLQNIEQTGLPRAYHSCGTFQELQVQIPGTSEFLDQNADGCPHYRDQGFPKTEPPCFKYKANEWITIQQHVKVGHWGQPDSTVEYWAADQGQTSRLIISLVDFTLLNDDPANAKYGKVWLLPYQTNKDDTQVTGTGFVWYDSLIISTQRIPDPDVSTPNAPDRLRAVAGIAAGTVNLTWRDNSGGVEQGFRLERCTGLANACMATPSQFTQVTTTGPNVTSYLDTGLNSGQMYTYRVKASDSSGDSAYSGGACWNGGNPCYSQAAPN